MSSNKFIERNMYTGSNSRKPKTALLWTLVISAICLAFGIYRFFEINSLFEQGKEVKVNRIENLLFTLTDSVWSILLLYVAVAAVLAWSGWNSYKNKTRIDPSDSNQAN